MSLDLWIGNSDFDPVSKSYNYTYNVNTMWYDIYPKDPAMVYIEGLTGLEAKEKLVYAVNKLRENPKKYSAMSPPNGWGCYRGFLSFLNSLIDESCENLENKWYSCR